MMSIEQGGICANCRRQSPAFEICLFGDPRLGACSYACALRLDQKLKSGLVAHPQTPDEQRIARLRLQLTIARRRLRDQIEAKGDGIVLCLEIMRDAFAEVGLQERQRRTSIQADRAEIAYDLETILRKPPWEDM